MDGIKRSMSAATLPVLAVKSTSSISSLENEIEELRALVQDKHRDAVLAAELGSQLLAENKKLTAQVTEKDEEIKILKERVQNVEDTLLEMAQSNNNENMDGIVRASKFANEVRVIDLERENTSLQEKCKEMLTYGEEAERLKHELKNQLQRVKKEVDQLRKETAFDHEENIKLRQTVDQLLVQIDDLKKIDEDNKKLISRLKSEQAKLQNTALAQHEIHNILEDNQHMKRLQTQNKKLETDLEMLKEENKELHDLLIDKEELAKSIQNLLAENEKYRMLLHETGALLEEAKRQTEDLRQQLEESMIQNQSGISYSDELLNISRGSLQEELELKEPKPSKPLEFKFLSDEVFVPKEEEGPVFQVKPGTPAFEQNPQTQSLQNELTDFRTKSKKFLSSSTSPRAKNFQTRIRQERQSLLDILDSQLENAEAALQNVNSNFGATKRQENLLTNLNQRLQDSKQKLKGVRCMHWPKCKYEESCLYHHPTEECKNFPYCPFGEKCTFIHSRTIPCKFGAACDRSDCVAFHPPVNVPIPIELASISSPSKSEAKNTKPESVASRNAVCKFGKNCNKPDCPYQHNAGSVSTTSSPSKTPTKKVPCKFGAKCRNTETCKFAHEEEQEEKSTDDHVIIYL